MQIRNATLADREAVFELAREFATSFALSKSAFEASYRELVARDDAAVLVVEVNGEVLGYCLAFDHATFFANGRVCWVEEITVRSGNRGTGLGRLLMNAVEEWAQRRKATLVALATRRASAFYKALNYEESAVYFRKVLPSA